MTATAGTEPLKVYWAPGCTSCLRMKEFLNKHGVKYVSVNALEDKAAFDELAALGVKRVPVARRGNQWCDGQELAALARIAGIKLPEKKQLPPAELMRRAGMFLAPTLRFVRQMPDAKLAETLPGRPRSHLQLACHIFQIAEAFLDWTEKGVALEYQAYMRDLPHIDTKAKLLTYGDAALKRLAGWWERTGRTADFTAPADLYYGRQPLHDFLERTAWHCGQHARQLQAVLEKLGIAPDGRLAASDLAGLPMPENIYDDAIKI